MEPDEEEGILESSAGDLKLYNNEFLGPESTVNGGQEEEEEDEDPGILDLSGQGLEKLSRAHKEAALTTTTLLLDSNDLQRLDNIHTYQCLEKLSVQNNRLSRIFQVGKLCHLKILNLANNSIVAMEGFKELKLLSWLSLASNKIKTIESLTQNIHLEHLDLSRNNIPHISDLSYLRNLKTLLLHENRIGTLRLCVSHLPPGLSTLTLNDNQLTDLTDASNLSNLSGLEQLTLANNPCIFQPEDLAKQFDYRPFVINWCLNVQVLDGIPVGAKESLKAEWMYSQSKGRHFDVGQHKELTEYLLSVCPLHPDENWEEDKKLNLILSKVQEHQESLRRDPSENIGLGNGSPRSNTLPRSSALKSPRGNLLNSTKSPRRNSGVGLCSSSSVENFRRPSGSFSSRTSNNNLNNVRSLSRSSTLKKSGNSCSSMNLCSYPVVLPRKLYDNNRNNINIMTQSLRFPSNNLNMTSSMMGGLEKGGGGGGDDLMTMSLDPSLLGNIISNEPLNNNSFPKNMNEPSSLQPQSLQETWSKTSREEDSYGLANRPDALFNNSESVDMTQSLIYPRLQSKLNTLPESLNSPDVPVPLNLSGKDDPLLSYSMRDSLYSAERKAEKASHSFGGGKATKPTPTSLEEQLNHKNTEKRGGSTRPQETTSLPKNNKPPQCIKNNIPSERKTVGSKKPPPKSEVILAPPPPPVASPSPVSFEESHPCNSLPISMSSVTHPTSSDGPKKRSTPLSRRPTASPARKETPTSKSSSASPRADPPKPSSSAKRRTTMPRSQSSRQVGRESSNGAFSDHSLRNNAKNNSSRSSSARSSNVSRTDNGLKGCRSMSRSLSVNPTRRSKSIEADRKDKKVREVKHEAKAIRGDDHIKFLTKELQSTKDALEKERKLRALQLDAIQVLWKEVQLMDATRGNPDRPRPSGSNGSKISSRSSEHSIAKLMDTLETISSSNYCFHKTESTLGGNSGPEDSEAVRSLNETCSSLQTQVEQLQGSLRGIVKFMSTFTNVNMERPSSSASQPEGSLPSYSHVENSFEAVPPPLFNSLESHLKAKPCELTAHHSHPSTTSSQASSTGISGDYQEESKPPSRKPSSRRPNSAPRPTFLHLKKTKEPSLKKLCYTKEDPQSNPIPGPSSVKEYAQDLADDLISGTIISLPDSIKSLTTTSDVTDISLSLQEDTLDSSTEKGPGSKCSNFIDTPTPTDRVNSLNSDEQSSHIDTDSLE